MSSEPLRLRDVLLPTRLIRTRPLFLASVLFLFGCILGYHAEHPFALILAAPCLMLLTAAFLRKRKRRAAAALLIAAMLPLGILRFDLCWRTTEPLPDQTGAALSGRICEQPLWNPETERTVCILDGVSIDGASAQRKLRLYLRGDPGLLQQISFGQRISCEAHIWVPDVAANPGEFDFSNYLRVRGLSGYATAEIESAVLNDAHFRPADAPLLLRQKLARHIERLFPENHALAKAFLLGDRGDLSDDVRESYSRSGAAHLLAISGMHISVLAAGVSLLLCRFFSERRSFLITLALLLLYGTLIGFSASLFRAIMMFALFGFSRLVGYPSDPLTNLGTALLVYLLIKPDAILDAGFILSFSACAGLILLVTPLEQLFHAEKLIHSKRKPGLRGRLRRILVWTISLLITSLAVQIAILPAIVHFFGAQPVLSLVVNLFAVPLAMAAYIASIIGALSCLAPVAAAGDLLFGLLNRCVMLFAELPLASLSVARFPVWLTLLCAAVLLSASFLSAFPEKLRRWLPLFILPAILISNGCARLETLGCSVVFLDAGHADCAVLRSEGKVYLFDCGDAYSPAGDYLSAKKLPVEAVFLSHMHSDHVLGLEDVLQLCTPKRIYISANWNAFEADEGVAAVLAAAQAQGSEILSLSAGDRLALSENTSLEVFSPEVNDIARQANDDSMVLRVSYRDTGVLFTGDASAKAIAALIPDTDVLKVPHHGSADGTNAALLAKASPSVAVIPCGYNNYKHPAPSTLELLNRSGALALRTDECGAVTCRLEGDGRVSVSTYFNPNTHSALEAAHELE